MIINTEPILHEWTRAERIATAEHLMKQASRMGYHSQQVWMYLSAAHIAGQIILYWHLRVHWAMLQAAVYEKNIQQIWGQVLRLALVPLGHLLQRLPLGNTGLAQVNAFKPMPITTDMHALLDHHRRLATAN